MPSIYINSSVAEILEDDNASAQVNCGSECRVCHIYAPYIETKFVLVVLCGTSIAFISAIQNTLLLYLFVARPVFRASHLFYMTVLAFFDVFVALSYISLMTVQVLMEYYHSLWLSVMWHSYLKPWFALCHVAMAASTFLILTATLERFIASLRLNLIHITQEKRIAAAASAVLMGFVTKGSVFFELRVQYNPNCTNHNRYQAAYSDIVKNHYYRSIWMFWLRNISTTFLPFFLIFFCNFGIVRRLRQERREALRSAILAATLHKGIAIESKVTIRAATRMLILIVMTYLIGNLLNVLITAWEHVDQDSLFNSYPKFYTLSADIVSLLTVLAGAVRLQIYTFCNKRIRLEVRGIAKSLCSVLVFPCALLVSHLRYPRSRHPHSSSHIGPRRLFGFGTFFTVFKTPPLRLGIEPAGYTVLKDPSGAEEHPSPLHPPLLAKMETSAYVGKESPSSEDKCNNGLPSYYNTEHIQNGRFGISERNVVREQLYSNLTVSETNNGHESKEGEKPMHYLFDYYDEIVVETTV